MPPKLELRELHEHAAARGGKFISDSYDGCRFHYLWECGTCKKQWTATWVNVKYHNSWCPHCRSSTREQVVRAAFRESFPGESFEKNQTEIGMELDGYCATHRLAFEHDGVQHRRRVTHFQRTEEDFRAQLARDAKKNELCDQEQIWLFRNPDRELLKLKDIRAYVRKQLDASFDIAPMADDDNTFLQRAMIAGSKGGYLDESSEIVAKQGGTLISPTCPIRTFPMHVSCEKGHNFETNYDNLVRGRWCPICCATRKKTEDELATMVTSAGFAYHGSGSRDEPGGSSPSDVQSMGCRRLCWTTSGPGRRAQPAEPTTG